MIGYPTALRRTWFLLLLTGSLIASLPAPAGDNIWTNAATGFAWNTTTGNWTSPTVWNNNYFTADSAVFDPNAVGTITVIAGINARSLNFIADGYTLNGGTINFSQFGTGTLASGQVNVGGTTAALSGTTATVNTNLVSAFVGLNKTGDGTLVLGGSANSFTGLSALGGSGLGTNILIGNATTTAFGGSLRLTAATTLPTITTVGIGFGYLDIQANNVTLAGITFTNTKANLAFSGTPEAGVIGTGTLTVTGPIRSIGNTTGWGNYINVPISAGGGTLRLENGNSDNFARDVMFLQPVSNGSLFKTGGVGTAGDFGFGGIALLANNTYTGATTLNGGLNIVAGTNTSTSLSVVAGTVSLQGATGAFGSATALTIVSNGTLSLNNLTNQSNSSEGNGNIPPIPAGNLDNRISPTAAVTLNGGTVALVGSATAAINQTAASFALTNGFNRVNFTAGAGQSANLTVTGNLTMGAGTTLVISGAGMQTTAAAAPGTNNFVVNGTVPAAVNGIIPGIYGTTTLNGPPTDFTRYSPTAGVGFVRLAPTDYTAGVFGATNNVNLTATTTVSTNSSANAIKSNVNITVSSGQVLSVGAGGILTTAAVNVAGPGTIDFGSNPALIFANSTTTTYSGPITGTAGLVRSGAGNVTLSGDLSGLTGSITNQGTATLNLNTGTFGGPINLLGGAVTSTTDIGTGGLVTLGTASTPAGTVGQSAVLNINNAAMPTFARNLATVGSNGTAPFAGASGLQLTTLSSGAQTISGNVALGTHLTINAAGLADTTFSGTISGSGGLNVTGGVVRLTNASNTFGGGLQLNGGTTAPTSDAALGNSGGVRFLGGTLHTDFAGTLNRGLTVLTIGTLNSNGNNVSLSGALGGENPSATFTKAGTGTLTLTAASPYPGSVTFAAAPNGGITLGGAAGALTKAASVTLPAGSSLIIDNTTNYNADRLADATSLTFSGGFGSYIAPSTITGSTAEQFGPLSVTAAGSVFSVTAGSASPTVVRFASLNVAGGSLTLRGDNLGGSTGNYTRIYFDSAPIANGLIIPDVFFANTAGSGTTTTFAQWDALLGVVQFVPTPLTGSQIDNYGPTNTPLGADFTTNALATARTGVSIFRLTLDGGSGLNLTGGNVAAPVNGNTPDGTMVISGGQLVSQNGAKTIDSAASRTLSLGNLPATITTNSDLTIAPNVTLTGSNGLTKLGTGNLTISSYGTTGPLAVNAGTITFAATTTVGNLSGAGTIALGSNGLTVNQTGTSTFSGTLNGGTTLTKLGGGTFVFAPTNTPTYSGGTVVADGTLQIGSIGAAQIAFGIGALIYGTGATSGTVDLNGFSPAGTVSGFTINGTGTGHRLLNSNTSTASTLNISLTANATAPIALGGNLVVNKTDTNTLTLTGTAQPPATTTGVINITAGMVVIRSGTPVSPGMSFTVANGATMSFGAVGSPFPAGSANNTDGGAFGTLTINAGGTAVVPAGSGDVAMKTMTLTGGTLNVTGSDNMWIHMRNTGASINILASNTTATFIQGASIASRIQNDTTAPLPINVAAGTTASGIDFDNGIKMSGQGTNPTFVKTGPGVMRLNNVNSDAAFQVNGGILRVDSIGGSGIGAITVNAGGRLGGTGTVNGSVTAAPGGAISPGASVGTLTVANNVTVTAAAPGTGAMLDVEVSRSATNTATNDLLVVSGASSRLNFAGLAVGTPTAGDNKFRIQLRNDAANPMVQGETYTLTLAQTPGVLRNGTAVGTNFTFNINDYEVISPDFSAFNAASLIVDGSNNVVFSFVPVPEPTTSLGLIAAGAFLATRVRRRLATAST